MLFTTEKIEVDTKLKERDSMKSLLMPNQAIPPEEPPTLSSTVAAEAMMILQLLLTLQEVVTVDLKTEVEIEAVSEEDIGVKTEKAEVSVAAKEEDIAVVKVDSVEVTEREDFAVEKEAVSEAREVPSVVEQILIQWEIEKVEKAATEAAVVVSAEAMIPLKVVSEEDTAAEEVSAEAMMPLKVVSEEDTAAEVEKVEKAVIEEASEEEKKVALV
jgi:hypothetical protein